MKILAIDPSSTKTGWATGTGRRELLTFGLLQPKGSAYSRVWSMAHSIREIMLQHEPDAVVIETPAQQARKIGSRGQATYGMAVGVILAVVRMQRGYWGRVHISAADDWGQKYRKPAGYSDVKTWRKRLAASEFPGIYDPATDPGGDTADAICLMQWWYTEQVIKEATV
jgi:hypothetical protein